MSDIKEHPTSQLLPFVQGDLDEDDARAVQDHLDACEDCSEEEQGIRVLLEAEDDELDDLERARLHHAVIAATIEPRSVHGNPLTRRLAPYLGTAAVLALLAVGILVVNPTGDDAESPTNIAPEAPADRGVADEAATEDRIEQDLEGGTDAFTLESNSARGAALSKDAPGPTPVFDPTAGRMAAADLDRLGRSSEPFRAFASAYRADAAPTLQASALDQLTSGLPEGEAGLVRSCARVVLRTSSADAALPVYGGYGSLDGEEVLLLGFAWTPATSGPLDRFVIWAWPRGSCESPLVYRFGWIDR